jgi:hypothetical protein
MDPWHVCYRVPRLPALRRQPLHLFAHPAADNSLRMVGYQIAVAPARHRGRQDAPEAVSD